MKQSEIHIHINQKKTPSVFESKYNQSWFLAGQWPQQNYRTTRCHQRHCQLHCIWCPSCFQHQLWWFLGQGIMEARLCDVPGLGVESRSCWNLVWFSMWFSMIFQFFNLFFDVVITPPNWASSLTTCRPIPRHHLGSKCFSLLQTSGLGTHQEYAGRTLAPAEHLQQE